MLPPAQESHDVVSSVFSYDRTRSQPPAQRRGQKALLLTHSPWGGEEGADALNWEVSHPCSSQLSAPAFGARSPSTAPTAPPSPPRSTATVSGPQASPQAPHWPRGLRAWPGVAQSSLSGQVLGDPPSSDSVRTSASAFSRGKEHSDHSVVCTWSNVFIFQLRDLCGAPITPDTDRTLP